MRKHLILFGFLVLVLPAFAQKTPQKVPLVIGVADAIQSKVLGERRVLNIYLPEGYSAQDTTNYSVIYLLDGSTDEDFIHVAGLVQFNAFPWINRLPKTILVGIANVDRRRDFTYPTTIESDRQRNKTAGQSAKFMAFIESELQPYIEKEYRATRTQTLIGQSLGGLLATEILLKKPALFDNYVIVSPSLWWDNGSLLKQDSPLLQAGFTKPVAVYIGVGKEGLTPGDNPRVMEVDANLLADKLKAGKRPNLSVHFDYLPQEDHATIGHQAISNAFRLLYPAAK